MIARTPKDVRVDERPWMGPRAEALERRLERPMLVAAALVIPSLVLGGTDDETLRVLAQALNWGIWLAFTVELVAMLAVVRSRRGWLAHNLITVAIVVFTVPFLPGLVQGARAIRVLRVARLLRLAPLFRLVFSLRGLRYASFFTVLIVLTGAAAFKSVETDVTYLDASYWALGEMTTVGSGNVVATTEGAKLLAMVLMVVGIGYFAVITGSIAERFIAVGEEERAEEALEGDDLGARLERISVTLLEVSRELEALRARLER
jgi:voltage-gated potassium channel